MPPNNIISSDSDYKYGSAERAHTDNYLIGPVLALCKNLNARKVLDLGCGNGTICCALVAAGYDVTGCDPSESAIHYARESAPEAKFHLLGVYDEPEKLGEADFDVVISTEVIEHLFSPRYLPRFAAQVLKPQGTLILSTPYHGYLKNLLLSLANKWDFHHTPLWDGGHVKFWSRDTLSQMLAEERFEVTEFIGTGRVPYLWKSMIIAAQKVDAKPA